MPTNITSARSRPALCRPKMVLWTWLVSALLLAVLALQPHPGQAQTPAPPVAQPDTPAEPPATSRVVSLNRTMTVRDGDNLGWIALRYGVDLAALTALNGLDSEKSVIGMGQTLLLPATADELRVAAPDNIHTVLQGESLGLIAQANGLSLHELLAANRISDPNIIQPGQKLVIPGPVREGKASAVGPARSGFFYHNVRPGDTMSQLAQEYETTPQAIVRYNSLPDEQTIYSGLEVRIPYGPPVVARRLPPTPYTGTEFIVSITRQRCWVMQNGAPLYDWKCSTGQGQWATRTGSFPIKTKLEMAQSSAYRLDMPFWLGLYDVGDFENGIHGLPVEWDTGQKLWDTLVGQPATFGCAMLLDEDAATLFALSYLGMPVHIVD
ncbi:MAG: LysM peptidoglycan-binding domain-containing protein [Chloroflexi bacterium]|nr:LysM peptidoglycan-binding domain-containing protein [Chloroflexota bacterium]